MKPYLTVSADVLIVGGGSAGVMAAIRAKQMDPKQKVVVFEKGDMKYSGCIARGMDAMNTFPFQARKKPRNCMSRPMARLVRASWTNLLTMSWPSVLGR